jgi:hypothetical protein
MNRERALKVVMVLVVLFTAAIYPVTMILWHRDQPSYEGAMGLSLYVTLGVLLLTAVRNPSAHRSLIAFAAWSSFAHAAVMTVMVFRDARSRDEWPAPVIRHWRRHDGTGSGKAVRRAGIRSRSVDSAGRPLLPYSQARGLFGMQNWLLCRDQIKFT